MKLSNNWYARNRGNTPKSLPATKYLILTVLSVIIIAVVIMFTVFKTDVIFDDEVKLDIPTYFENIKMVSVVKTIEQSDASLNQTSASNISVDAKGWYTDMPDLTNNTNSAGMIGKIPYYSAPTFASTSNTFFYFAEKAKLDLYDYLDGLGVPHKSLAERSFIENNYLSHMSGIDTPWYPGPTGSFSDGTKYRDVNGVKCIFIAPPPCASDKEYYSSGKWGKDSDPGLDYHKVKYNIVLVPNGADKTDTSKYIYIPAVAGSSKAHTYPWGVAQTCINIKDNKHLVGWKNGHSWGGWDKTVSDASTEQAVKEVCSEYDDGAGYGVMHYMYCTLELCATTQQFRSALTSDWDLVGFITYRE